MSSVEMADLSLPRLCIRRVLMIKALAIGRVSTKNQAENNHSLDAQRTSIDKMADGLGCTIIQRWEMHISSRKGKNLKRRDLNEAMALCKFDKSIKYILLDRVNRLGREAVYLTYYMLDLKFKFGVQLIFCDPSQQELNDADDPKAFLKIVEKLVQAEQENDERSALSLERMQARVRLGYYPFYPHQGYKRTDNADGLHVRDEPRYSLLREALKSVAGEMMTPKEAQLWLYHKGYRTPRGGKKLDLNRFTEILTDPYYAGILEVSDWHFEDQIIGLHEPMITPEDYNSNVEIALGRKVRKKNKFNPNFPLNTAYHADCVEQNGKVSGANHSNGKGWSRNEYICRNCNKRVPSKNTHENLSVLMDNLVKDKDLPKVFEEALREVWQKKEEYRIERTKLLNTRASDLEETKSEQVRSLINNPELAKDIKIEIQKTKELIKETEEEISKHDDVNDEYQDFFAYAVYYTENLRKKWWSLPPERKHECKELLFKSEIVIDNSAKVYTPNLSMIYRLMNVKSDSKVAQKRELVEMAGIAPASKR